jgi:phage tail tape-measure protein
MIVSVRNPVRLTEKMNPQELITTNKGQVSALRWCMNEAKRLQVAGIPAQIIQVAGKTEDKDVVYVVRTRDGFLADEG